MEIVTKNVNQPRLTLTPTRTTLKLPIDLPTQDVGALVKLAESLEEACPAFSVRGRFFKDGDGNWTITLRNDSRHIFLILGNNGVAT